MKVKNSIIVLLIIILLAPLTGCYKQDKYTFPNGTFTYRGDPFEFYNDLVIDELEITFNEIPKEVYLSSNNQNVIKNHHNKTMYAVKFKMKYTIEDKARDYQFEYIGKVAGQNDSYKIILKIDNDDVGIVGTLSMTLYFDGGIESTEIGSLARRIAIYVRGYEINGTIQDDKYKGFPRDLKLA